MATLNRSERRKEIASKHADYFHTCQFCGGRYNGNGGYSAHMRKEYFERMPDMKSVKWVTVKELRAEWRKRNQTKRAVDVGDSAPLQAESTLEVNLVAQADTTPAPKH